MKIAVQANDEQWSELNSGGLIKDLIRVDLLNSGDKLIDAFLILDGGSFDFSSTTKPVIVNSVCNTILEMKAPSHVARINGWNSFLKRSTWEVAGNFGPELKQTFSSLGKQEAIVADQPGFIAARIISMIINEAYFALGENISTREQIDIAMKTGTNYPYGPFEWAGIIGIANVCKLLKKLEEEDRRYQPAPLLNTEV